MNVIVSSRERSGPSPQSSLVSQPGCTYPVQYSHFCDMEPSERTGTLPQSFTGLTSLLDLGELNESPSNIFPHCQLCACDASKVPRLNSDECSVEDADDNHAFFSEERGRTRESYSTAGNALSEFAVNTAICSAKYAPSGSAITSMTNG